MASNEYEGMTEESVADQDRKYWAHQYQLWLDGQPEWRVGWLIDRPTPAMVTVEIVERCDSVVLLPGLQLPHTDVVAS